MDEIRRTEVPEGLAMAPWAIGWYLQHPAVSCVVAGCKSVEQLQANAAAANLARDDHPLARWREPDAWRLPTCLWSRRG